MKRLDKNNIEDILSLTPMQEGMLFHYLKEPEGGHYFEQLTLEISGDIDFHLFERAWNFVIETNEMLRTVFRWEKVENPIQIVLKEHKIQPGFFDFSANSSQQKKKYLEELKISDRKEKFDLREVPFRVTLCKVEKAKYEMIISNHHILYDGWSNGIILKEFFKAYHELCKGKPSIRPSIKPKPPFKEFIKWMQNHDRNKQEQFWREYLDEFDTPTVLPVKRRRDRDEVKRVESYSLILEEDIKNKLDVFVTINRVTLASVLYSAWGILLQKYCSSDDVIFGTTVAGRPASIKGIEDMVGLFINTIPLRVQAYPNEKISDLVFRIDRILQEREEFENTPLVDIRSYSPVESSGSLFDTIAAIENYPLDSRLFPGDSLLSVNSYFIVEMTNYDLAVGIIAFDDIKINFTYHRELFDKETVFNLARHFKGIVQNIVEKPAEEVYQLELISREEKNRLLYDFNNTTADYPKDKLLYELFVEQTAKSPDSIAVIGPLLSARLPAPSYRRPGGDALHSAFSYRELNKRCDQLAYFLKEKGVGPDTIVGIMSERSIEMVVGIMGILKAGGAYLPIEANYPEDRVRFMLADSNVRILLEGVSEWSKLKGWSEESERTEGTGGIEVIGIGNVHMPTLEYRHPFQEGSDGVAASGDSLAYVLYTSGSTGRPKGVTVQHGSVLNILSALFKKYPLLKEDTYLLKTTYTFDVSVSELFGWYLGGGRLAILEPGGEKDPLTILDWIERIGVTHINFVPSMFGVFLEMLDPRKVSRLSNLKYIFLAGEALAPHLVNRFKELNTGIILENIYGPTENTIYTSQYSLLSWQGVGSIPIGKPFDNIRLYILNASGQLQPIGVWGELCIRGKGLARGYLNRPELTCEKFIFAHSSLLAVDRKKKQVSFKAEDDSKALPMSCQLSAINYIYKSGDLARWLVDGNIEFLGRIDHQVKIRGYRIELGEIENQLLKHPRLKEAVVVVRGDESEDKYLCGYIVPDGELDIPGLRKYLSGQLTDYMIPSYFMALDSLPLDPNGKIDRKTLPIPVIKSGVEYIPPADEMEMKLLEIWSQVLALEKDAISVDVNFFQLGGHSLKATRLTAKINKVFNVKVPLAEVFKNPTIRKLSHYVKKTAQDKYVPIKTAEKKEYYPLSSAQKRLFVFQQMNVESIVYNMNGFMVLEGSAGKEAFEKIFLQLIHRHGSLRTSFFNMDGKPVQKIHDNLEFSVEYYNMKGKAVEGIIKNFVRPFDLLRPPLLRAGLIKTGETRHLLMMDIHHIVTDGTSMGLFIREFMAAYAGEKLPLLRLQYKDYAEWQNSEAQKSAIKQREEYWIKQFEHEPLAMNLPTDFTRPGNQHFEGSTLRFQISMNQSRALKGLALKMETTLYMVLLAAFNILLSKLSGQEDIVVGTPTAGRGHVELEQINGMFVNTLALRNRPEPGKAFTDFLKEVKENTLAAFENQDYPFEELVEQVAGTRDVRRNPLFDVMFVMQNMEPVTIKIPGLTPGPYEYDNLVSKFDLTLNTMETEQGLMSQFEYCTGLFKKETIERWISFFKRLVSSILDNNQDKIGEIEIISGKEKRQILFEFNDTFAEYPNNKTIINLFESQVRKTPDHIAVVGEGQGVPCGECRTQNIEMTQSFITSITYRHLDEKSHQLARILMAKGIVNDTITALMAERSIGMMVAIFGILKAGGAYLPIDPNYPPERIDFMLKDSSTKFLLVGTESQVKVKSEVEERFMEIIDIDISNPSLSSTLTSTSVSTCQVRQANLAYVIYTSGSTGKPKGVMIEHPSLVNRLNWMQRFYPIGETDIIVQKTPVVFDVSVWELFWWSFQGASLGLLAPGKEKDPGAIIEAVEKNKITTIHFVPSMLNAFLEYLEYSTSASENLKKLSSLRQVFSSGEALGARQVAQFNTLLFKSHQTKLFNLYGPTEATVDVSYFNCPTGIQIENRSIPIGKPIDNIRLYVINKDMGVQPPGITGELCIAGDGLARGYLNRPELTADTFVEFSLTGGERLYKTGDSARWLWDGNLEFLGRLDHQVKVRGFRIEPGEIENQLRKCDGIREAVVVHKEDSTGDKYLVAFITINDETDISGVRKELSKYLPDYMVPAYFIPLDKIPLTTNGKVNRRALLALEMETDKQDNTCPRDPVEEKLAQLWSEALGIEKKSIGIDSNFFRLGGHSLKVNSLVVKLHKEFNVKVQILQIFKTPTIRELAAYIKETEKVNYISIRPTPAKEFYALSSAQKRLFILDQVEKDIGTAYNLPGVLLIEGEIHIRRFEEAFQTLIKRHESLRTSFALKAGEPVQIVHDDIDFNIKYLSLKNIGSSLSSGSELVEGREGKQLIKEFIKPFDLSTVPLFRVELIRFNRGKHMLLVDMHHIISDGVSVAVMVREIVSLYEKKELPPLRVQYKDFSEWQNRMFENDGMRNQREYWQDRFSDDLPVLNLKTDYPRVSHGNFAGDTVKWEIDREVCGKIKQITMETGTTIFMVLLSVFYVLLSKYTGQEDITVGVPAVGRNHAELGNIIGMFVNTLAMRNFPLREYLFEEFLDEVRENTLKAYENQDYPLEELITKLNIPKEINRNPLFDTLFVSEDTGVPQLKIDGLTFTYDESENKISHLDLVLYINEKDNDKIKLVLEYSTALFSKSTAERMLEYYVEILTQVVGDREIQLKDIEISHALLIPTANNHVEAQVDFGF